MALMQWGDRWVAGSDRAPLKVIEESSGSEIAEIQVTTLEGKPLRPIDVRILPGPGAAASTRARFGMSQPREPELPAGDAVDLLSAPPIDEA